MIYSVPFSVGYENRYYFNLGHIVYLKIVGVAATDSTYSPYDPDLIDAIDDDFSGALQDLNPYGYSWPLPVYGETAEALANKAMLKQFLFYYLFPKHWEEYILPYSSSDDSEAEDEAYKVFWNRFISLLVSTFPKYSQLITIYKEKESDLMDRIGSKSTGITRFNDTPQEGGDFSDEDHTTNATTNEVETESDFETPIKRLKDIRDNLEDLYNAWAFEFDKLFTEGDSQL